MRSEAKRKWDKENKSYYSMYLMKSTDGDVIEYLESVKADKSQSVQGAIKAAIRFYLAHRDSAHISTRSDTSETE
ncbi:hypothetical protein [Sphaerochaeta sp. S2]|uniref:hypothetical protein n=1 Tax=Sphaerochaeta sp. S2 TaxID=2798868 RepID=UPI0018E9756B|nr:hypothetical protein [Sphaerochaeta sp. S2]MBJ2356771.1 hypothetical protein [Sphaerochaeta sp. S2]